MDAIAITGATGFLGSHLARSLLGNGCRIVALKRSGSTFDKVEDIRSDVSWHDVDKDDLEDVLRRNKVGCVIHTATSYGRSGESISEVCDSNIFFPLKLLEAAALADVRTFVNSGTALNPLVSPYSLSKQHFVEWGRWLAGASQLQFVQVQMEHIYGPGDDPSKFVSWVINGCLRNLPSLELTAGEQQRDFVYISDVVEAYIAIIDNLSRLGQGFQVVPLGSGSPIKIRDFVVMAHRLTGSQTNLNFGAVPYRVNEEMISCADIRRLKSIGWRCRVGLESGIGRVIEAMKV